MRNHFAGLDYIDQETSTGVHNRSVAWSLRRSPVVSGIEMAVVPPEMSLEGAASVVGGALTTITAFERKANPRTWHQMLITDATGSVGVTGVQLPAPTMSFAAPSQFLTIDRRHRDEVHVTCRPTVRSPIHEPYDALPECPRALRTGRPSGRVGSSPGYAPSRASERMRSRVRVITSPRGCRRGP